MLQFIASIAATLIISIAVSASVQPLTLESLKGTAEVRSAGKTSWTRAHERMPLYPGDLFRTGAGSRAILKHTRGNNIILGENSVILIQQSTVGGGAASQYNVQIQQLRGRMDHVLKALSIRNSSYKVMTPVAVAGVRGTEFGSDVQLDPATSNALDNLLASGPLGSNSSGGGNPGIRVEDPGIQRGVVNPILGDPWNLPLRRTGGDDQLGTGSGTSEPGGNIGGRSPDNQGSGSGSLTVSNEGRDRLRVEPGTQTTGRGVPTGRFQDFVDFGSQAFDLTSLGDQSGGGNVLFNVVDGSVDIFPVSGPTTIMGPGDVMNFAFTPMPGGFGLSGEPGSNPLTGNINLNRDNMGEHGEQQRRDLDAFYNNLLNRTTNEDRTTGDFRDISSGMNNVGSLSSSLSSFLGSINSGNVSSIQGCAGAFNGFHQLPSGISWINFNPTEYNNLLNR